MDSILNSVKKVVGLGETYTPFDPDIIMHINTTFFVLNQLGVGPEKPLVIEDASTTWDAFDSTGEMEAVKTYVGLKVRLLFDPPSNSALLNAIKENIAEYEWRLRSAAEIKA